MQNVFSKEWPIFFTATIQNWKSLLEADQYKEIIVTSLNQLVAAKKVKVNTFVIMHNHVHLIWQSLGENKIRDIEISFKKFTAKRFREQLLKEGKLKNYIVNKPDRKHQFWKRNSLSIELFTPSVFQQKLNYIHQNPVRSKLCVYPEEYYYSSAMFYFKQQNNFSFLTHFED